MTFPNLIVRRQLLAALLLVLVVGCDVVEPERPSDSRPVLLVGNQGNFSSGNGSISSINLEDWSVRHPIQDLESIVQSMVIDGDRLFVISNTGQRLDVFEARTTQRIGMATGLISPRYATTAGDLIFVTNLYADATTYSGGIVSVVNAQSLQRVESISVGDHPEGIATQAGAVFVANHGFGFGGTLSVIDPASRQVTQTLDAECEGPRFVIAGTGDDLFVTCTGATLYNDAFEVVGATNGAVVRWDARNRTVVARRDLQGQVMASDFGQDAFHDADLNRVFVIENSNTIRILDGTSLTEVGGFGPVAGDPIGAVAFDGETGEIYLARVGGFTTSGTVTVHRSDGSVVRTLQVGIAPTSLQIRR